jgi:hypothetical protein
MKNIAKHIPLSRTLPDVRTDPGFYDRNQSWLIGWPGYRTREGKSGLAYMDTVAEEAHLEGLMLRWLYFEKFRTRNPVYLLFLFVLAVIYAGIPLALIGLDFWASGDGSASLFYLILSALPVLFGWLLLKAIWFSLMRPQDPSQTGD